MRRENYRKKDHEIGCSSSSGSMLLKNFLLSVRRLGNGKRVQFTATLKYHFSLSFHFFSFIFTLALLPMSEG
jgi:hypothetical protein